MCIVISLYHAFDNIVDWFFVRCVTAVSNVPAFDFVVGMLTTAAIFRSFRIRELFECIFLYFSEFVLENQWHHSRLD